jgi:beta-N-acetylhexosaminidase
MYRRPIFVHMSKIYISVLLIFTEVCFSLKTTAQNRLPVFITPQSEAWADSVLSKLTYEQKIGQLFMIDAYSNRDTSHVAFIESLIKDYHIGGVIFFQGGPVRQANLTNYYQSIAKIPLLIGIDGEWGLSMRLDSTIRFPRQMTLGAAHNSKMIHEMGVEIGRECKRMGIHVNFAPVADINNNPRNPVINSRSFGEVKENVAEYALNYMRGMQSEHVMACGKHFPGHGNTDTDSHFNLPVINQSITQLDSVELYPFKELIANGIAGMMVAHLHIPAYDTTANRAATLSPEVVNGLLRTKLNYDGLVFTDALNMKGVADFYPSGNLELLALLAGNDVLLYSLNVPQAWNRIDSAIKNCEIEQALIDQKVKKILMAKYWVGLNKTAFVDTINLINDLNTPEATYLTEKLYENAVTLLKNEKNILPIHEVGKTKIISIAYNDSLNNPFQQMLGKYAAVEVLQVARDQKLTDSLIEKISKYDIAILSIHNTSTKAESLYGIPDVVNNFISQLNDKVKLITVVFGNAYTLTRMPDAEKGSGLILAYEDTRWPQYFTAQAIFGASKIEGKIPVTPGNNFIAGSGMVLNDVTNRLRFTESLEAGIAPEAFSKVDSIAQKAIQDKATPGCQVLVSYQGRIIYQKAFGNFTYELNSPKVKNTDVYDIASITKIAATALAVMKLYEEGGLDIEKKASKYLHELRKTNKKDLLIKDILTHQSGLKAWIPFWKSTLENGKPSFNIFHYERDVNYSTPVADSLFMLTSYTEKIWDELYDSELENQGKYVYSDLGMLIIQKVVEEITGMPLDKYLTENFYQPLGLTRLLYQPAGKIPMSEISPTENDTEFRNKVVQGYVHDPAAAMLGGIAGNAGLFSDSYSLAVVMQMLMNGGEYGGNRFLKHETIDFFTTRFNKVGTNRRGLIFDRQGTGDLKNGNLPPSASLSTFGHTGFTGTATWADPEKDLVFVFLSNRVYPDAKVNKLAQGNYRTDMLQAVYDILLNLGSK